MAGALGILSGGDELPFNPGAPVPSFDPRQYIDPNIIRGVLAAAAAKKAAAAAQGGAPSAPAGGGALAASKPAGASPIAAGLAGGALAASQPVDSSNLADVMRQRGLGFLPDPAQIGALQQARDQAAQQRLAVINSAMDRLRGSITGNMNIPLLAAGAAMLKPAPNGQFVAALGNAMGAGAESLYNQRNQGLTEAEAEARLASEAGSSQYDAANANVEDFYKRANLGEGLLQSAGLNSYRDQTGAYRQGMLEYHNQMAQAALARSTPAQLKEADALVQSGVAPDRGRAVMMLHGGYSQSPVAYANAVSKRMGELSMTPQGASASQQELHDMAVEQLAGEGAGPQATPAGGTPYRAPGPKGGGASQSSVKNVRLQQARDAIKHGAPRDKVAATLKSLGIDPKEL